VGWRADGEQRGAEEAKGRYMQSRVESEKEHLAENREQESE
jgi:hypothetical protein